MTPEQRDKKRAYDRMRYANMSPEKREKRLAQKRKYAAEHPTKRTLEQREKQREPDRIRYANMTPEQREKRLAQQRKNFDRYRLNMTPEQREEDINRKVKYKLAYCFNVEVKEVPVELLETKIAILNVKRKVKELMK